MASPDVDYFSETSIEVLEEHLQHQIATGTYDGKVIRGLMKLYQMFPSRSSRDTIVLGLAKALTALPEPDFLRTLYLVPQTLQADATVVRLMALEAALQAAKFDVFWTAASEPELREFLNTIPGFDDAIRVFILKAVSRVYQKIDTTLLATLLHSDAEKAAALCAAQGWAIEGSDVCLPLRPENTPRPVKAVEDPLQYADLSALVQLLSK